METRYLKTLVKAAETGSFSKAAAELHITQSAASQRIKFLEEFFGHQLLDRSGTVLVPTGAGEIVITGARRILDLEKGLMQELKRLGGEKRIALGCTPTFGTAYLPKALNAFILQHADLADFKFIFHTPLAALRGLEQNDFDLAVIEHCGDIDMKTFKTFELPQDELVFISAPRLGLPTGTAPLDELLPHRVFVRKDGCSSRQMLKGNLAARGLELEDFGGVVTSDDFRLTIQTVIAGGGISFISRALAKSYIESGELQAHHVEGFTHFRCRTAALNVRKEMDFILQEFIRCIYSVFEPEELKASGISPGDLGPAGGECSK